MRCASLLAAFALLLTPAAQAYELQAFTAQYKFNLDDKLSGTATRSLEKKSEGQWLYTFSASAPMATATETSRFRFDGRTVTPLHYQQQRKIFMVKRSASVEFDWSKNQGHGRREGKTPADYTLQAGTLDTLNLEVQIRRDLKELGKLAGPYWIASPKRLEKQPFIIVGEETINTPAGKFLTLKVSRVHDDPKRHTSFWLAKNLDYLPVKVVQDNDGTRYGIELSSYKPAAAAGKP